MQYDAARQYQKWHGLFIRCQSKLSGHGEDTGLNK
jgi:hypothetical protein